MASFIPVIIGAGLIGLSSVTFYNIHQKEKVWAEMRGVEKENERLWNHSLKTVKKWKRKEKINDDFIDELMNVDEWIKGKKMQS